MEKAKVWKSVMLQNKFESVWKSLSEIENGVSLETGEYKTRFVAKAVMPKRNGKSIVEALVFMKTNENGKLKECSRCYVEDWSFYFNHFGVEGQRIGMYCLAVDCWVTEQSIAD
jgi:hypothetical protein